MTVPARAEALNILVELDPPAWLIAHSTAVAEIAAFLAERLRARGHDLPTDLPETAALLHDVDKTVPVRLLRKTLGHGFAGAAWLAARGHPELGPAVAGHPASRLSDDIAFRAWLRDASLSEKVVAYADKRAAQDIVSMDERFAKWRTTHPERAVEIGRGRRLADELERAVTEAAEVRPADVARLAWVELPVAP